MEVSPSQRSVKRLTIPLLDFKVLSLVLVHGGVAGELFRDRGRHVVYLSIDWVVKVKEEEGERRSRPQKNILIMSPIDLSHVFPTFPRVPAVRDEKTVRNRQNCQRHREFGRSPRISFLACESHSVSHSAGITFVVDVSRERTEPSQSQFSDSFES